MPSMPKHEPEESASVTEQEPVVEAGNLFPVWDEPETSEGSDNETKRIEADNVSVEDVYKRQDVVCDDIKARIGIDRAKSTYPGYHYMRLVLGEFIKHQYKVKDCLLYTSRCV